MRLLAILVLCLSTGGCAQVLKGQAQMVHNLEIQDALAGYRNAAAPLDRCVKAKLVAVAYADAHETANAAAWNAREREDCAAAVAALGVEPPMKPGD
jgi:hypothetical protein